MSFKSSQLCPWNSSSVCERTHLSDSVSSNGAFEVSSVGDALTAARSTSPIVVKTMGCYRRFKLLTSVDRRSYLILRRPLTSSYPHLVVSIYRATNEGLVNISFLKLWNLRQNERLFGWDGWSLWTGLQGGPCLLINHGSKTMLC